MDTISWLLSEAFGLVGSFILNFLTSGLFYGFLGFLIGCLIVFIGHRRGGFKRPRKAWNLLAKLHYFIIPVLLGLCGMSLGFVRGTQSSIEQWTDDSSDGISEWAEGYIPTIEKIAQNLVGKTGLKEKDIDESIEETLPESLPSMVSDFVVWAVRRAIGYGLQSVGLEDDPNNIAKLSEAGNLSKMKNNGFKGVSSHLKQGVGLYINPIYWGFLLWFGFWALFPLGEYLFYRFNKKVAPIAKDKFNNIRNR